MNRFFAENLQSEELCKSLCLSKWRIDTLGVEKTVTSAARRCCGGCLLQT